MSVIASLITSSVRQRESLTIKLLECYLMARKDLAHIISELANLDVKKTYENEFFKNKSIELAELYFKYFDFLPDPVLNEMTLLKVCLERPQPLPYMLDSDTILSISKKELSNFINKSMLYGNSRKYAAMVMGSDNTEAKQVLCIVMHATRVLLCLNKYIKSNKLLKFLKNLKK